MSSKGPNVPPAVAAALIALVAGGAVGYYAHEFAPVARAASPRAATPSGGPGGGGGPAMGGRMGGGGGGFGAPPTGGAALARLVRSLNTVESLQGQGLTPDQSKALLPILKQIKSADKLPAAEADKQTAAIEKLLTPAQKDALAALQPQRGGGGGGGRGGGMGGPGGGGGMPMMGGGGFGGGNADPDRPFASERSQKALDGLIAQVSK
jgi:hypothetical protein